MHNLFQNYYYFYIYKLLFNFNLLFFIFTIDSIERDLYLGLGIFNC